MELYDQSANQKNVAVIFAGVLSARNAFHGRIEQVHKGVTTTVVKVDIGNGLNVTSSITNESADELDLKPGDAVTAIIKSSDVIIGKL